MPFSAMVNETEKRFASRVYQRLYRIQQEMEELEIERTQLIYIRDQVLKQCMRCGGSGTVCEGRTGDDMPVPVRSAEGPALPFVRWPPPHPERVRQQGRTPLATSRACEPNPRCRCEARLPLGPATLLVAGE